MSYWHELEKECKELRAWLQQAEADNAAYRTGLIQIATTIEDYYPSSTLEQPRFSFAKKIHDMATGILALAELEEGR